MYDSQRCIFMQGLRNKFCRGTVFIYWVGRDRKDDRGETDRGVTGSEIDV